MPRLRGYPSDYRDERCDRARPQERHRRRAADGPAGATSCSSPARVTRPPRPSVDRRAAVRRPRRRPRAARGHAVIAVMIAGATAMIVALFGTRVPDHVLPRAVARASRSSARRTTDPSTTWPSRARPPWAASPSSSPRSSAGSMAHLRRGLVFSTPGDDHVVRHPGHVVHGLPRRLHQGHQGPQPRHLLEAQELDHARPRTADRLVAGRPAPASARRSRSHAPRRPGGRCTGPCGWCGPALIIWSTTNAVNVTDGLDGLAGGSAMLGFLAFTIIAYWAFRNPDIYGAVVNPLDLAVLSPPASPVPAAGSCGSTRHRRGSSWATSARSASARRWRCWRSAPTPRCCCC